MKSETNDIYEMLDILALPVAAQRFAQLSESPELGSYTALQFIREVLEPQYIETLNKRFETNLRLSSLINKGAVAENLKTGNGRIYNDATVEQVLKFHFAENRNAPTSLMKELHYGEDYIYAHDTEEKVARMQCLPDGVKDRVYYHPGVQGAEAAVKEKLEAVKRWKAAENQDRTGERQQ